MTDPWIDVFTTLAISCASGLALVVVVAVTTRVVGQRWEPAQSLARSARIPFRLLILAIAVLVAVLTRCTDHRRLPVINEPLADHPGEA